MSVLEQFLRSELAAWVIGAVALAVVTVFAFSWVGWLGFGLVGLVGLVTSTRLDLHGGGAVPDSGFGSGPVALYARQLEMQRALSSPEQKLAAEAERQKRDRTLYLMNTVFIPMTVMGLVLFFRYQL